MEQAIEALSVAAAARVSAWSPIETTRTLLRARDGVYAKNTRLLLFSGVGFTDDLLRVAGRDDVVQFG